MLLKTVKRKAVSKGCAAGFVIKVTQGNFGSLSQPLSVVFCIFSGCLAMNNQYTVMLTAQIANIVHLFEH